MSEQVLVIKNTVLNSRIELIQGVNDAKYEDLLSFFNNNCEFLERSEAEYNFNYKQLIPYIIVKYETELYVLKRLKKQTEKRLHNQYSIGIGGHINPSETGENVIPIGLFKELLEEIKLETVNFKLSFKGLLNDESTEVSKVHLGLIIFLEIEEKLIEILEVEKMKGEWMPIKMLNQDFESLESWSQIIYTHFFNHDK